MSTTDSYIAKNISATTAAFALMGGRYVMAAIATWGGGNVALQMLAADGSTWVAPMNIAGSANSLTANGSATLDLSPGQYRIAVTTATGVYATVARVP
jgi:hypothetical protein